MQDGELLSGVQDPGHVPSRNRSTGCVDGTTLGDVQGGAQMGDWEMRVTIKVTLELPRGVPGATLEEIQKVVLAGYVGVPREYHMAKATKWAEKWAEPAWADVAKIVERNHRLWAKALRRIRWSVEEWGE